MKYISAHLDVEVYNITCSKYSSRIKFIECEVLKFATNRYGISIRLAFDRDMGRNLHGRTYVDTRVQNAKRPIRLFDFKINACKSINVVKLNKFVEPIFKEFKRTTNLPTRCPFKGNVIYRQDNFSVQDDKFPPFVPAAYFFLKTELYDRSKLITKWAIESATFLKVK
ncbi:uncharacterized protein LOC142231381 [Haematobia irritans]|uniref:uncharacterized protein LOC142231381 n=1 Tax=Haematobia irritans TaxID=7368 RepID=UPI003F4F6B7E